MAELLEPKSDGTLYFMNRIWVPLYGRLRELVLAEAHKSRYSVHPGTDKMFHDLKEFYWWPNMKREVAKFVSKCLTCQKVKIDHKRPMGKVQPLEIPSWKWDSISMDFVTGLPKTRTGNDTIWVIVDRLTKSAMFIPIKETWKKKQLATLM